ncbi:MAG: M43 family zinc metalloprotease [Bacteroidota bacterium]
MVKNFFLSFFISIPFLSSGQERYCPSPEELHDCNPSIKFEHKEVFEDWIQSKIQEKRLRKRSDNGTRVSEDVIKLPVVVHIVHRGESIGTGTNISDAQIVSQIDVLNEDFRRLNQDTINTPDPFIPVAADAGIEFVLAKRTPEGLATNGITRTTGTQNSYRSTDAIELAEIISWPAEEYINVWVAPLFGTLLGFAQFPISDLEGLSQGDLGSDFPDNPITDGMVISPQFFGSIAKGNFPFLDETFNLGRTTTHEMGHFLGLRHIWGDGNNCSASDFCGDTPVAFNSNFGCPIGTTSCESIDMIQNYMDFTDDVCMNLFTSCQTERMQTVLEFSPRRMELVNSPALIPLGDFVDLAITDVLSPGFVDCDGFIEPQIQIQNQGDDVLSNYQLELFLDDELIESLVFTNQTLLSGSSSVISFQSLELPENVYQLEFQATILESEDQNLSNNNLTLNTLVDFGEDEAPVLYTYNDTIVEEGWNSVSSRGSIEWSNIRVGSFEAVSVQLFNNGLSGDQIRFISPSFDLSNTTNPVLNFDFSYRGRQGFSDLLNVYGLPECEPFEIFQLASLSGASFSSDFLEESWFPQNEEDWESLSLDLSPLATEDNVRIVFEAINRRGNNIYLDEIAILSEDGELPGIFSSDFQVYPNPATDFTTLYFNRENASDVEIILYDISGQTIDDAGLIEVQNQNYRIDLSGFVSGFYLIRVIGEGLDKTSRLFVDLD